MGIKEISYISILNLAFFLVPIFIINRKLKISININILSAITRMSIQLTLVGIFLQYIFKLNNGYVNLLYLLFMIIVASISTIKKCKFRMKKFVIPLTISFLVPNIIILLYFNLLVIKLDNILNAQYLIPIMGMLLGNSLKGNIICLNSFYKGLKDKENEYLYTLSLSGSKVEALRPHFKKALQSAVDPTIASIETIGLVSLPGMMTGQILSGSIPIVAIKYQIAAMVAILIGRYFSAMLSIILTSSKAFDDFDILIM